MTSGARGSRSSSSGGPERLPNATVVELDGDHACHIESIDAFLEAFEKHLASA